MTKLFVVVLYPYEDGSEARYQFDTRSQADAFADRINKIPANDFRDVTNGSKHPIEAWESSTYDSTAEALAAFGEAFYGEDEDFPCYGIHNFIVEDGKDPDGPATCTECGHDRIDPD